ncbi:hypothetical protein M407DRAFT_7541 [Tulasnella calospora MUT 4182]|uniref:Uncharacterized protein n=1 Tax=Tulasnella calospora MUT 4182 TaxID=1051891 RepID=A0A0C3KZX7_9AGAM|nr:hypothetical protein M407DRAFT_7541 [Tulasnella calospora MUT 4182]
MQSHETPGRPGINSTHSTISPDAVSQRPSSSPSASALSGIVTEELLGFSFAAIVEAGEELEEAAMVAKLDLYWLDLVGVCPLFGEEIKPTDGEDIETERLNTRRDDTRLLPLNDGIREADPGDGVILITRAGAHMRLGWVELGVSKPEAGRSTEESESHLGAGVPESSLALGSVDLEGDRGDAVPSDIVEETAEFAVVPGLVVGVSRSSLVPGSCDLGGDRGDAVAGDNVEETAEFAVVVLHLVAGVYGSSLAPVTLTVIAGERQS